MSTVPTPTCGKAAGRPKASDVEARMHDLIETAGCLFLKNGYTKVSLESIAREAHVAVRTIYVKFGGKAGLLKAVLTSRRDRFFTPHDLEADTRPFKEIVDDFARHFFDLLYSPEAIAMHRVVIAEAPTNPELAQTFNDAGPRLTREMLERFFARADIRAQLRPDLPFDQLPTHLLTCIGGDVTRRFLFPPVQQPREEALRQLDARMSLFYRAVLADAS
ncbi:TetR/AcrR family transcriptional regulator [Massilia horti]|uniref:TetR/AcrR family transcriptional regulator n=1 Tax=Massilia horti TaxID=2562153 RepID=A0A4Y9T1Q1_9BURK|nr:TetR/AcrR family transcriptional regulator [Massilia horti]TFW33499.1 TetR/AcrR family transcriptional regulator [Massilia horti]